MKMFDNLIFNDDRNTGNFMLDESWNVILIDHSRAFIDRKNLIKGKKQAPGAIRQELLERLQALTREGLESTLDVLQGGQIKAILARRDKLLEHQQKLVDERGEARVMFN